LGGDKPLRGCALIPSVFVSLKKEHKEEKERAQRGKKQQRGPEASFGPFSVKSIFWSEYIERIPIKSIFLAVVASQVWP
jgi:hypothetical protein